MTPADGRVMYEQLAVLAIIVLEENLPGSEFIVLVVACTVGLSPGVHGISANPLASWIAREPG